MSTMLAMMAAGLAVAPPPRAVPAGKWTVEYNQDDCVLRRDLTIGERPITFAITPQPLTVATSAGSARLVLIEPARPGRAGHGRLALAIDGTPVTPELAWEATRSGPGGTAVTIVLLNADMLARVGAAATLAFGFGRDDGFVADLPGLPRAMAALRGCDAQLAIAWGVPADEAARIATPPAALGDPVRWLSTDDYPAGALARREEGMVRLLLRIAADGGIAECRPVVSSGSAELDAAGCRIVRRSARYKPAIGRDGRPIEAHLLLSFTWRLP